MAGSSGASNGWIVSRTWSRTISRRRPVDPGHLRAHATPEFRQPPQEAGQPGDARFHQHHLELGELGEGALADEAAELRLERLRVGDIVLDVVARPAERGHRLPVAGARMDADRQVMLLRRGEQRPPVPAPERRLLHGDELDLHEALVGRAALDLVDRVFDVLGRHHDRGAQPRIAIEPFLGDVVVDRARDRDAHVLAVGQMRAVETVEDRRAGAEPVEHLRGQRRHVVRGAAVRPLPVLPHRDRRARRIGIGLEAGNAALGDRVAPVVVEVRQQRLQARHGRMHVAVDGGFRGSHAAMYTEIRSCAPVATTVRLRGQSTPW